MPIECINCNYIVIECIVMNKIKVIRLIILGTVSHYTDQMWIDDENHPDGGSFQGVLKTYKKPRIEIDFLGESEDELVPGCIYVDGMNSFIAVNKHEFQLMDSVVETFQVPQYLLCISNPYLAGTGQPR